MSIVSVCAVPALYLSCMCVKAPTHAMVLFSLGYFGRKLTLDDCCDIE